MEQHRLKPKYNKGKNSSIRVKGFPIFIDETFVMHPNFEKLYNAFPQIQMYFEPIPKKKKKVDEEH
jgi:hypothetical protein